MDLTLRQEERPAQSNSLVVEPVKVDGVVMDYIEKIKSKELDIIKKRNAVIMNRDDIYVTFRPMSPSGKSVQAQFAREQFITLYQKIATGLQSRTYHSHYQTPNITKVNDTPYKQTVKQQKSIDQAKDEACPICLETLNISESTVLSKCKHRFCKDCLERAFHVKPTCPICGEIYGNLTGTQPKGSSITVSSDSSSLPGYENYGTIIISYYIPSGRQGVSTNAMKC